MQNRRPYRYLWLIGRVVILSLAIGWGVAHAETFSECILENMKSANTNAMAAEIKRACRNRVLPYVPKVCINHSKVDSCSELKNPVVNIPMPQEKPQPQEVRSWSDYQYYYLMNKYGHGSADQKEANKKLAEQCKSGPVWFERSLVDQQCVDRCLESSWWDKKFGNCKP